MFNRVELKSNAKSILRKNYWWIVLVTLIFGIVSGTGSGLNFNINIGGYNSRGLSNYDDIGINNGIIDEYGNIKDTYNNGMLYFNDNYKEVFKEIESFLNGISLVGVSIFLSIFLCAIAIVFALAAFVLNPLQVGCRRWYLLNRKGKPEIGEIAHIFSNGYGNTVKVMFCRDIFIFLWSLLFIIPGIIKSYEYRMVPYLLAENPEMDRHEAFARSKAMMDGNKGEAFVLDLSFLGWLILSGCLCGILSVLYVAPYIELTNTELYVCLCQGREKYTAMNNNNGNQQNNFNNGFNNPYN